MKCRVFRKLQSLEQPEKGAWVGGWEGSLEEDKASSGRAFAQKEQFESLM